MAISFSCDSCGREYNVGDSAAGKKTKCKDCGEIITVPSAKPKKSREPAVVKKTNKKKKPVAEYDDYEDDYAEPVDDYDDGYDDDYADDGYDDDDYDEPPRRRSASRTKSRSKSAGSSRKKGGKKKKKSKKGSGGGGRIALIIGGAVVGLLVIGGFGFLIFSLIGDSPEAAVEDMFALLDETLSHAEGVTDNASAEAAATKIRALKPKYQKLVDRLKKFENVPKSRLDALKEKHKDKIKSMTDKRMSMPRGEPGRIVQAAMMDAMSPFREAAKFRF